MTEAIPHAHSRKNLLLHPLTHAVYAIDEDAVFNDHHHCIDMVLDDFEKFTQTGPCSAERLVEYTKMRNGGFNFSQLVFLKLRGDTGGYAWASRLRVHVNWAVPEVDDHIFGQEFLWIWPTSAAINAFVCYQECNSLGAMQDGIIKHFAPATGHEPSLPGAQIGPDDFDGVQRVPHTELTSAQRLFIASIRPQRTQFQRRRLTDKWPSAMKVLKDKQEGSREHQFWRKHKRGTTCETIKKLDQIDWSAYTGFDLLQLPGEIVTRLMGATIAVSMTENVCVTAKTICSLRCVSKHVRTLTDGFVGLTLAQITDKVTGAVRTGSEKTEAMLNVGTDLRALGITPLLLLKLRATKQVTPRAEAVREFPMLHNFPTVPSWQSYLKLRARLDKSVAAEARPVRVTKSPSHVHKHVCLVNGIETLVHVPEFDECLARGSPSPSVLAMQMMERVGV